MGVHFLDCPINGFLILSVVPEPLEHEDAERRDESDEHNVHEGGSLFVIHSGFAPFACGVGRTSVDGVADHALWDTDVQDNREYYAAMWPGLPRRYFDPAVRDIGEIRNLELRTIQFF